MRPSPMMSWSSFIVTTRPLTTNRGPVRGSTGSGMQRLHGGLLARRQCGRRQREGPRRDDQLEVVGGGMRGRRRLGGAIAGAPLPAQRSVRKVDARDLQPAAVEREGGRLVLRVRQRLEVVEGPAPVGQGAV